METTILSEILLGHYPHPVLHFHKSSNFRGLILGAQELQIPNHGSESVLCWPAFGHPAQAVLQQTSMEYSKSIMLMTPRITCSTGIMRTGVANEFKGSHKCRGDPSRCKPVAGHDGRSCKPLGIDAKKAE